MELANEGLHEVEIANFQIDPFLDALFDSLLGPIKTRWNSNNTRQFIHGNKCQNQIALSHYGNARSSVLVVIEEFHKILQIVVYLSVDVDTSPSRVTYRDQKNRRVQNFPASKAQFLP